MTGIRKRFGSTHALRGVDLELRPARSTPLVGENGAGKSTLMKVLSGAVRPDAGTMTLDGQPYAPPGPQDARRHGVAMIYQELTLAPHLSVEANVMLGLEQTALRLPASGDSIGGASREALARPGASRRSARAVRWPRLGPAAQQLVEIARALLLDVRVLVLDEPTSSLTQETPAGSSRWSAGCATAASPSSTSAISSKRCRQIADRFTVLRDGRSVGGGARRATSPSEHIIELMVGRSLTEQFPRVPHAARASRAGARRTWPASNCRAASSLTLHRGEILGHRRHRRRGPDGTAARRSSASIRCGAARSMVGGIRRRRRTGPRQRIAQGRGPAQRGPQGRGAGPGQSIADNLTYSRLRPYSRFGWLNWAGGAARSRDWLTRLRVRCRARISRSASCPAATSRRWRWAGCCTSRPTCCCWTSRPAAWTSAARRRFIG